MALTRYFSPSPSVTGPLEFLARFGQERSRVHEVEAGMDFQQMMQEQRLAAQRNAQIAGAITGFGLQANRQGFAASQSAAARVGQAALQQQRLQEGRYQDAADAYTRIGGVPGQPPTGFGSSAPSPSSTAGPTLHGAGGLTGPPAPGEAQPIELAQPPIPQQEPGGVPLPINQPTAVPQYREAVRKRDLLTSYASTIQTDPNMPADEKSAKLRAIAQSLAPLQAFIKKQPAPRAPRSYQELAAAGPAGGGFTAIPGTYNFAIPDGKGGVKVSTAVHPEEGADWRAIPDPVKRDEAKRADLENNRVLIDDDEYLWDGKKWDKQKSDRSEFDSLAYAQKRLATRDKDSGQFPTADKVVSEIATIQTGLERFELQQAVQEAPDAEAILNIIKQRARISQEDHERLIALNDAATAGPLPPELLLERSELAEAWLDAFASLKDAGVQIPGRLKIELLKQIVLLRSYLHVSPRP